jgi:hypothetical protein
MKLLTIYSVFLFLTFPLSIPFISFTSFYFLVLRCWPPWLLFSPRVTRTSCSTRVYSLFHYFLDYLIWYLASLSLFGNPCSRISIRFSFIVGFQPSLIMWLCLCLFTCYIVSHTSCMYIYCILLYGCPQSIYLVYHILNCLQWQRFNVVRPLDAVVGTLSLNI